MLLGLEKRLVRTSHPHGRHVLLALLQGLDGMIQVVYRLCTGLTEMGRDQGMDLACVR